MSTHCSNVETVLFPEFRAREPMEDVMQPTDSAVARAPMIVPGDDVTEDEAALDADCVCVPDPGMLETEGTTSSFGIAPNVTGAHPVGGWKK